MAENELGRSGLRFDILSRLAEQIVSLCSVAPLASHPMDSRSHVAADPATRRRTGFFLSLQPVGSIKIAGHT
jgi:hypothetical protein